MRLRLLSLSDASPTGPRPAPGKRKIDLAELTYDPTVWLTGAYTACEGAPKAGAPRITAAAAANAATAATKADASVGHSGGRLIGGVATSREPGQATWRGEAQGR